MFLTFWFDFFVYLSTLLRLKGFYKINFFFLLPLYLILYVYTISLATFQTILALYFVRDESNVHVKHIKNKNCDK